MDLCVDVVPSANLYVGLLEWQRTHRGRWRQARAAGAYGGLERWTTWRGQRMFGMCLRVSKALEWGGRWEKKAEGRNDDGLGKAGEERRVTRGQTDLGHLNILPPTWRQATGGARPSLPPRFVRRSPSSHS